MFPNGRIVITGGEFNMFMNNLQPSAFKKLWKASSPSALYDSSARCDPPKCHPNTRVAILEYLMGWIFGRNDPEALIMWLYGPAGAGKTAISQTIAERCAEKNKLLASFFLGRSDPSRNHIKPLIPTIACQIAITIPELKPYVEGAIERDPFLLDKSLATQFQLLVVVPLQALVSLGTLKLGSPRLIIIDGLDECDDPKMQSMLLRVIADALRSHNVPLIFLIASRPEQNIKQTFSSTPLSGLWRSVVLDDKYKPNKDIHLFLMDSFNEIKTTHPHRSLISTTWPRQSDIDTLIWKSSGQFIYASQVMKYISDPNDNPSRRLDVIRGLRPARRDLPFAELDALYKHLLEGCSHHLDIVLKVLGLFIIGITNAHDIEVLLEMERGDVTIRLAPLASVVRVDREECNQYTDIYISLLHASFREFLTDPSRASPKFYIDPLAVKERGLSLLLSWGQMRTTPVRTSNKYISDPTLSTCFQAVLQDLPLTKNIEDVLMDVSLSNFWMSIMDLSFQGSYKCGIINHFLEALHIDSACNWNRPPDELEALEKIYNYHKSSFEPILKLELSKYSKNTELTILVILLSLDLESLFLLPFLRFSTETRLINDDSLCLCTWIYRHVSALIHTWYRELLPAANPSDYVPTTLKIMEFICGKPPHPMRHYNPSQLSESTTAKRKQPTNRPPTYRPTWMKGLKLYILTSYATYQTRRHSIPYSRFRRQEKHCHGVWLRQTPIRRKGEFSHEATRAAVNVSLVILEKCSKSEELIAFIRTHGKKIAFIQKKTPKLIRVMHAYLDQATQDVEMVDSEHFTL